MSHFNMEDGRSILPWLSVMISFILGWRRGKVLLFVSQPQPQDLWDGSESVCWPSTLQTMAV